MSLYLLSAKGDLPVRLRVELFPANLEDTLDFYTRVLGFEPVRYGPGSSSNYLLLRRGGAVIAASSREEVVDRSTRRPPVGVEIVLEVDDLASERRRVMAANWPVLENVTRRPWGARDFRLVDPSGYYVNVTEPDEIG